MRITPEASSLESLQRVRSKRLHRRLDGFGVRKDRRARTRSGGSRSACRCTSDWPMRRSSSTEAPLHGRLVDAERAAGGERAAVPGNGEQVLEVVPVERARVMRHCGPILQSCAFRGARAGCLACVPHGSTAVDCEQEIRHAVAHTRLPWLAALRSGSSSAPAAHGCSAADRSRRNQRRRSQRRRRARTSPERRLVLERRRQPDGASRRSVDEHDAGGAAADVSLSTSRPCTSPIYDAVSAIDGRYRAFRDRADDPAAAAPRSMPRPAPPPTACCGRCIRTGRRSTRRRTTVASPLSRRRGEEARGSALGSEVAAGIVALRANDGRAVGARALRARDRAGQVPGRQPRCQSLRALDQAVFADAARRSFARQRRHGLDQRSCMPRTSTKQGAGRQGEQPAHRRRNLRSRASIPSRRTLFVAAQPAADSPQHGRRRRGGAPDGLMLRSRRPMPMIACFETKYFYEAGDRKAPYRWPTATATRRRRRIRHGRRWCRRRIIPSTPQRMRASRAAVGETLEGLYYGTRQDQRSASTAR